MSLLEFVEEDDGEGLLADEVDEGGAVARLVRFAEYSPLRVPRLKLAHVEADHALGRAEEELRERLGDLGLARARRPDEEEDALRARRVGQSGFNHRDALDQTIDGLGLAEHALLEEGAQLREVEPLALVEYLHGQPRQLRERDEQVVEFDLFPGSALGEQAAVGRFEQQQEVAGGGLLIKVL